MTAFGSLALSSLSLYITVAVTDQDNYDPAFDEISFWLSATFTTLVFLTRASASLGLTLSYYSNVALTPPMLLSSVYACTNIFCRSLAMFSSTIAELAPNPSIFVTGLAVITFVSTLFIKENTRTIAVNL